MLVIYCPQLKRHPALSGVPDDGDDSTLANIQRLVKALEAGDYSSPVPTPEFMVRVHNGLSPSEAMLILRGTHVPEHDPVLAVPGTQRTVTRKMKRTVYREEAIKLFPDLSKDSPVMDMVDAAAMSDTQYDAQNEDIVDLTFPDWDWAKFTRDDAFQKLVQVTWPTERHERMSLENEERFVDYLPLLTDPAPML